MGWQSSTGTSGCQRRFPETMIEQRNASSVFLALVSKSNIGFSKVVLVDVSYKGFFLLFSLFFATLFTGCVTSPIGNSTGTDVTALAQSLPQVKAFLENYPDAKILVALWGSATVEKNLESIRSECGPQFAAADYYKVTVSDQSFSLVVWLDKTTQEVVCVVNYPSGSSATPMVLPDCPQYSPPAEGWCANGTIVMPEIDANGCIGQPTCVFATPIITPSPTILPTPSPTPLPAIVTTPLPPVLNAVPVTL